MHTDSINWIWPWCNNMDGALGGSVGFPYTLYNASNNVGDDIV